MNFVFKFNFILILIQFNLIPIEYRIIFKKMEMKL